MTDKPIVCIDLDGVLNMYDGFRGGEYFHPPRPGAREFLEQLKELGYYVVIFTVRWGPFVESWLALHGLNRFVDKVTDRKPAAHVFVDDRAICFQGDFQSTLKQVAGFRAHWERECEPA